MQFLSSITLLIKVDLNTKGSAVNFCWEQGNMDSPLGAPQKRAPILKFRCKRASTPPIEMQI